jgi:hypothetical protein
MSGPSPNKSDCTKRLPQHDIREHNYQEATHYLLIVTMLFQGAGCSPFFGVLLCVRLLWMNGSTPPPAIVARTSMSSSSSPRMASCKCRGVMRLTRRSLDALPAIWNVSSEGQRGGRREANAYRRVRGPLR